ncbi:hypothetical protein WAK64_12010 [Bacillus spongiae]|uniref:Uncharacterized protein n=1 Tax=Bacillus spongiae TaxID=2683610 RepID=A0ABU8HES4_9BACI
MMDENLFEKRMDFLKNSYKKLPIQTDSSAVLAQLHPQQEKKEFTKSKRFLQWPYVASFFGVVSLAVILLIPFIGEEDSIDQGNQYDEPKIEVDTKSQAELNAAFQELWRMYDLMVGDAALSLNVSREFVEQANFVQSAKSFIYSTEGRLRKDIQEGWELQPIIDRIYSYKQSVERSLLTPEQWMRNTHTLQSEEEVVDWLTTLIDKVKESIALYDEYFLQLPDQGKDYLSDDYTLSALQRNAVALELNNNGDKTSMKIDYEKILSLMPVQTPEAYTMYLQFKVDNPSIIHAGNILVSWQEHATYLVQLEDIISKLPNNSFLENELKVEYDQLLSLFVNGSYYNPSFNEKSVLKEEVRSAYLNVIELYPNRKTTFQLHEIYQMLKENGFKKPHNWDAYTGDF